MFEVEARRGADGELGVSVKKGRGAKKKEKLESMKKEMDVVGGRPGPLGSPASWGGRGPGHLRSLTALGRA